MRNIRNILIEEPVLIKDTGLHITRREARQFEDLIVIQDIQFSGETRCLTYKGGASVQGASKLEGVPSDLIQNQRILFNLLTKKKCEECFSLGKPKYTLSIVEENLDEYFNCPIVVNVILVDMSEGVSRRHLIFARNAHREYQEANWNIKPYCSVITRKVNLVQAIGNLLECFNDYTEGSTLLYEHNSLKLVDLPLSI